MKNKKNNGEQKIKTEALQTVNAKEENFTKPSFSEKISLKFRRVLLTNKLRTWFLIIFLIVAFIALNMWARSKDLAQIDVTKNKLYSLTDVSKTQLSNIDKDVTIYIYGYTEDHSYVNFVKQYVAFNEHIKYEIINAETNYEMITKYDLNSNSYNTMIIICGDKEARLYPDFDFETSDYVNGVYENVSLGEEKITNAILKVITDDPIKVYVSSGHGEYTLDEISELLYRLEEQVYECEELKLLSTTEIPGDCDILAILDPTTDITEEEANVLKEYVLNGGNIFFGMVKQEPDAKFSNLQKVLDLYGVSIDYGVLYEGSSNNRLSSNGMSYPFILLPNASSESEASASLVSSGYTTVIPWAQRLTINEVKEDNVTVESQGLLYTSDRCYALTDISKGLVTDGVDADTHTIAAKLTRTMTTPSEEEGKEGISKVSNIIVVGNCSFLANYDQYIGYPISYQGNSDFALNCFADLAEQEDLIAVRKSSNVTTFVPTTTDDLVVKTIIFSVPIIIIFVRNYYLEFKKKEEIKKKKI